MLADAEAAPLTEKGWVGWTCRLRGPMTLWSTPPHVTFAAALGLKSHNCALSTVLSPSPERCGRFASLHIGKDW
jgi:hypothetical protein